jgi:hypothetical protein
MLFFPQLLTGAVSQFPGSKRIVRRTILNETADGSRVKLGDAAAGKLEWALELKGLADTEWDAIEELFEATEGRLGSFTFLDPFGNLLSWSEDLNAAVWQKTGVGVVNGREDPLGGYGASLVTNGAAGQGRVSQSLAAPGRYTYCLSVYARSSGPCAVALFASTQSASAERVFGIGPAWRRLEYGVDLPANDEGVEFGVAIAPGGAVELFGFQVEPQAGASRYKKTTGRGGVHSAASFADDELVRTAEGKDDNSCTLRIRAGE